MFLLFSLVVHCTRSARLLGVFETAFKLYRVISLRCIKPQTQITHHHRFITPSRDNTYIIEQILIILKNFYIWANPKISNKNQLFHNRKCMIIHFPFTPDILRCPIFLLNKFQGTYTRVFDIVSVPLPLMVILIRATLTEIIYHLVYTFFCRIADWFLFNSEAVSNMYL